MAQDGDVTAYWTVEYLRSEDAVCTTASGEMTSVLVMQKASETLQQGSEYGTAKFLINDLDVQPCLTTTELYALPALLEPLGLTRKTKVAVVYSRGNPSARDFEFAETVALNRGFNVRVFTTVEEAREWLG